MKNRTTHTLSIILASVLLFWLSPASAVPNEAISCNQEGSEISGRCSDGNSFSLDCVNEESGNEVDCDHDDDTLWGLCDDQCTETGGHGWAEVKEERSDTGSAKPNSRPQANRLGRTAKRVATTPRVARLASKARTRAKKGHVFVGKSRIGGLSINHRTDRSGEQRVIWTYRHRSGGTLTLNCNLDQEQCAAFENGRSLTADNISQRGLAMAADANQLMTQFDITDVIGTDAVDAICFAAGIATGFWPIGTLIAGPTAVGCLVMYALEE
jgi:hypothetical protein